MDHGELTGPKPLDDVQGQIKPAHMGAVGEEADLVDRALGGREEAPPTAVLENASSLDPGPHAVVTLDRPSVQGEGNLVRRDTVPLELPPHRFGSLANLRSCEPGHRPEGFDRIDVGEPDEGWSNPTRIVCVRHIPVTR